jgi:acetylornithine aminotransferase/acetylornithine/N-succinyldiaminopimelate aminotransferase
VSLAKVQKSESKFLVPTYERNAILATHGKGVYLYDSEGNKYLDFLSGIGVNALGYSHPAVTKVIREQAGKLVHTSNLFFHPYQAELAERLTKAAGMDRAFFSNSGTEAWEGAIKLARAVSYSKGATKKTKILALENSFHGRTFGSLATTYTPKYRKPFAPMLPGVEFVKFNDVEDLKKKLDDTVCAIGFEPVQGEGGINPVSMEFMAAARQLATAHGALLILDEIQCGLGRTGKMFAFQHYKVKPDIVTLAKPLAAGLPLGAILTTEAVSSAIHPGMHGTTFGGGPLACAAAVEVLNVIEKEKLLEHNRTLGGYFIDRLRALDGKHACIEDVRGVGLMIGVELNSADLAKDVVKQMLARHILINRTHDTTLRFLPPYIVTRKHVDEVVEALDQILSSSASAGDATAKNGKAIAGGSKKAPVAGRSKKK